MSLYLHDLSFCFPTAHPINPFGSLRTNSHDFLRFNGSAALIYPVATALASSQCVFIF
jgi:hypothetical protein